MYTQTIRVDITSMEYKPADPSAILTLNGHGFHRDLTSLSMKLLIWRWARDIGNMSLL